MNVKTNNYKRTRAGGKKTAKGPAKQLNKLDFTNKIAIKTARKLRAQRSPTPGIWFGLGMMGVIGWSVVLPTLLGTALGIWLDKYYTGQYSWTLALLVAGLTLGCFNAWYWIDKEYQAMHDQQEHNDE